MRLPRPRTGLGWATLANGAWVVANGVGHIVGSLDVALRAARPYDYRLASLMFLGLGLIFAGALQLAAARGVDARGHGPMALAGASALFVVATVLIFLPVLPAIGIGLLNAGLAAWLALAWRASAAAAR